MKRKLTITFFALLTIIMLSTVPVSAKKTTNSEKAVRATVASLLKNCKNYNAGKIRKYFVKPSKAKVFYKKKYTAKFMKKVNKKYMKYHIDEISVKGSNATAYVSIENLYIPELYSDVFDDVVDYMAKHKKSSDRTVDKYCYKRMNKYYKSLDYYIQYNEESETYEGDNGIFADDITLKLKKVKGKWKVTKMPWNFNDTIHSGYVDAYEQYFD